MAHQIQKNTIQMDNYLETYMPTFEQKSIKNFVPLVKSQNYFSTTDQNLWEKKNRMTQKIKIQNNYDEDEEAITLQLVQSRRQDDQKKENEQNSQRVQRIKQESSERILNRQQETIHTQYLSNQQLNEDQQKKLKHSIPDQRPMKTGQITRIINNTPDNKWNHLETKCKKHLKSFFTKNVVDGEVDTFTRIKIRVRDDEDLQVQRRQLVMKNKQTIQAAFKQQQDDNNLVHNKLRLKSAKTQVTYKSQQNDELYQRLSQPRELFHPENTGELPEMRDLITSKLGKIDEVKNPYLIKIFEKSQLVKRNILLQTKGTFKPRKTTEPNQFNEGSYKDLQMQIKGFNFSTENLSFLPMDTVDLGNEKNLELKEAHVIWEIDDFEQRLKKNATTAYFSQIKEKEYTYLQSFDGYKSLQNIRNSPGNYQIKIGDKIREQQKAYK